MQLSDSLNGFKIRLGGGDIMVFDSKKKLLSVVEPEYHNKEFVYSRGNFGGSPSAPETDAHSHDRENQSLDYNERRIQEYQYKWLRGRLISKGTAAARRLYIQKILDDSDTSIRMSVIERLFKEDEPLFELDNFGEHAISQEYWDSIKGKKGAPHVYKVFVKGIVDGRYGIVDVRSFDNMKDAKQFVKECDSQKKNCDMSIESTLPKVQSPGYKKYNYGYPTRPDIDKSDLKTINREFHVRLRTPYGPNDFIFSTKEEAKAFFDRTKNNGTSCILEDWKSGRGVKVLEDYKGW